MDKEEVTLFKKERTLSKQNFSLFERDSSWGSIFRLVWHTACLPCALLEGLVMNDPIHPTRGDRARNGSGVPGGGEPPATAASSFLPTSASEADDAQGAGTALVTTPRLLWVLGALAAGTGKYLGLNATLSRASLTFDKPL